MSSDTSMHSPGPDTPAVVIEGVSKCYHIYRRPQDRLKQALWRGRKQLYREFWALRNLSLTIPRGQTVSIIGRNGAGKSTLLQLICGTVAPTTGRITVNGGLSALLELGAGFNPQFSGRENVYLAGALRGLTRKQIDERFDDITAFADIGEFIDQPVKTYSSGMYVRLAFAVASQIRPDVLVVDEALAVGDIYFRQKCHTLLREKMGGCTKLLVSHDMQTVSSLSDRVIVLSAGRAVFDGPPKVAVERYVQMVHEEQFGAARTRRDAQVETKPALREKRGVIDGTLPWINVRPDCLSGAREVVIERVALARGDGSSAAHVYPGLPVHVRMIVRSDAPKSSILFGYTICDARGQNICGQNSVAVADGVVPLDAGGRYLVHMRFDWPEIRPGEYTVTLGVGEGADPVGHTIQCWAHNVTTMTATCPNGVVHSLFNNPIHALEVTRVG